ncbi:membrane protein [Pseudogulbenkiania ferrooxidans EGD-HP2]|uniref:Membrane protein n=1 Tax=Pseudogulbenkiania ferrooxidans EGD-HP2 TaxID=1388764 RepID=A0ABN0N3G1_9NEIS|nr:membrane protein [Pseudogulbenkiania ferrooxidans EGD-HP2]
MTVNRWHTDYLSHPLYRPARRFVPPLADWPDQAGYDALLDRARAASAPLPVGLRFVCELEPDAYYEMHIGTTGEVPTRARNWHDWFNALAWLAWPRAKAALNRRHVRAIARGEAKRVPLRDAATLFDECGVIVAVADPRLGQLLDDMRWRELFIESRDHWGRRIAAHTLGHALMETGLAPHLGWCGKALIVEVGEDFFGLDGDGQTALLDAELAARLDDDAFLTSPRALCPLPLLGIPGWWPDNEDPAFYDNADYFRPTRRAKSATVTA